VGRRNIKRRDFLKNIYYRRPKLNKARWEITMSSDLNLLSKIYGIRVLDEKVYKLNLKRIKGCRKGTDRWAMVMAEIRDYERYFKALEVMYAA
jgi:hypothetical protein